MKKKMERREFLQASRNIVGAISALSTGITILPRLVEAATKCGPPSSGGGLPHRKYLINIECSGGIDNGYLASPYDSGQFSGQADRYAKFPRGISHVAHPGAAGHFIGPGLLPADGNGLVMSDLLGDFFFVKGLAKEGEHGLGNRIVANGGTSVYNAGYCSLFADYCAKYKEKAFQHVAIGGMGYNQTGMLSGAAVPTLMNDMGSFQNAVKDLSGDQAGLKRKGFVQQMVKELYSTIAEQTLEKCESQKMYQDFGKFFDQVIGIREKPILYSDPTVGWDEIWNWWQTYVNDQQQKHPCSYAFVAEPKSGNPTSYFSISQSIAFEGAFTEFLIRRDLTSVVNMKYDSGDRHSSNANSPNGFTAEGQIQAAMGTLFVGLMYRLKKIKIREGGSLLDRTLMVVTSEFDRTPFSDGGVGTDHGNYNTLLMAGSGHRGVFGGIGMERGPLAGFKSADGTAGQYKVLTMNPDGSPNKDGNGISLMSSSILPLISKITGVPLPSQQISVASQGVDKMTWIKKMTNDGGNPVIVAEDSKAKDATEAVPLKKVA